MLARRTLLPLALAAALVSGCGLLPGDSDGTPRERFGEALDDVRSAIEAEVQRAVEEAREQQPGDTGDIGQGEAPEVDAIRTDTNTAFDYAEYTDTLEQVCPAGDFIAWDETRLLIPYYVQAGDFVAAFVLAHEFGHAMQARLPQKKRPGILNELQADCFSGAWARDVQEQDLLSAGDLDEATLAVFSARDVPGTDFTDPAAHGSGFERTRAFSDGYESGAANCYPAPGDRWLIGR